MLTNAILPITFGAFGMIAALLIYVNILKTPSGEGRVKEIADEIHLGAMVFMASEYKRLAIFCLICIVALYASLGADTAISFTLGALCSGVAGECMPAYEWPVQFPDMYECMLEGYKQSTAKMLEWYLYQKCRCGRRPCW